MKLIGVTILMRVVDLSLTIENNMPVQAVFPRPVYTTLQTHEGSRIYGSGETDDPHTSSWKYLAMVEHTATHVDAFFHMNPNGATIDQMPLDMFMGKAVCLDVSVVGDGEDITVTHLESAEVRAGLKIDGHIVLLHTGFHARNYPDPSLFDRTPGLTAEATHWLADRRSRIHGIEGPSTDRLATNKFPSHRACRDRGITHYEWLVNLESLVDAGEFWFCGVPLKLDGGTGAPVRAFALVDA